MKVWRHRLVVATAMTLIACGLGTVDPVGIPGGLDRPAGGVQQLPGVHEISVTPTSAGGTYFVTLRFSSPMEVTSLVDAVFVAPAASDDGTLYSLGPLIEPDATFGYHWDSTFSTLTVQFLVPDVPIWRVVVSDKAQDRFGARLDGTSSGALLQADNLARRADNGFSAPASHVSLPYYADPGALRPDHPSFRLNDDLPRAKVSFFADESTLPWAELEADNAVTVVSGTLDWVEVTLLSRNARHTGDAQVERAVGAYFHPSAISHVVLLDAQERTIDVDWSFDLSGRLRGQRMTVTSVTVDSQFVGLDRLQGMIWDVRTAVALLRTFNGAPSLLEFLQPVTGGVLFPATWLSSRGFGISTELTLRDLGQAWPKGLFVQQAFDSVVVDSPIVDSGGNYLVLADPLVGCEPSCPYSISYRPWVLLAPGQGVELVSSTLYADTRGVQLSEHPLPWHVVLQGGNAGARDWRGLGIYDGVRDGDESTGQVDDRIRWTLTRP